MLKRESSFFQLSHQQYGLYRGPFLHSSPPSMFSTQNISYPYQPSWFDHLIKLIKYYKHKVSNDAIFSILLLLCLPALQTQYPLLNDPQCVFFTYVETKLHVHLQQKVLNWMRASIKGCTCYNACKQFNAHIIKSTRHKFTDMLWMWQHQADTGQHNDALKLHRVLVHSQLNLY